MSNTESPRKRKDEATSASVGTEQPPSKRAGTPTEEILPCPSPSSPHVVQPNFDLTKKESTRRTRSLGVFRRLASFRMRFKSQKTCPNLTQSHNVRRS